MSNENSSQEPENDAARKSTLNDLLSDFDKLSREEQDAFLAWFAGGNTIVTTYDNEKFGKWVYMGKSECEQVDFKTVWLGTFRSMGWFTAEVEKTGTAIGMINKPQYTKYRIRPTAKGFDVQKDYWDRLGLLSR